MSVHYIVTLGHRSRISAAADGFMASVPRRAAVAALGLLLCLGAPGYASESEARAEDAKLRDRIEAQLASLPDRDGAEIQVAVRGGHVVLRGKVRLLEQSLRAEQVAWRTPGVLDVDNELRVKPPGSEADVAIERAIRMIIKGDERFVDTNLELGVQGGVVELRGRFNNPADVLALKHQIASIPGVMNVLIDAVLVARGDGHIGSDRRIA